MNTVSAVNSPFGPGLQLNIPVTYVNVIDGMEQPPHSLKELLDRVCNASQQGEQVTMSAILDELGHRSFGAMLLFPGLVMAAPVIGDIPGVPSTMGLLTLLTAGQLLFHHHCIWLPSWMLKRSVARAKVRKTVRWLWPVAVFLDRWTRPRWQIFVHETGTSIIAFTSMLIAAATPAMEIVPLTANLAGVAIGIFGLALVARDGLLALLAMLLSMGTFAMLVYALV